MMINQSSRFKVIEGTCDGVFFPLQGTARLTEGKHFCQWTHLSRLLFNVTPTVATIVVYLVSSDRRWCSRITTKANAIHIRTSITLRTKKDWVDRANS